MLHRKKNAKVVTAVLVIIIVAIIFFLMASNRTALKQQRLEAMQDQKIAKATKLSKRFILDTYRQFDVEFIMTEGYYRNNNNTPVCSIVVVFEVSSGEYRENTMRSFIYHAETWKLLQTLTPSDVNDLIDKGVISGWD